ncbi:hypothetical protein FACS1894110_20820 [Spirochaetia bacterium]|nr:hypothetical protein FACS1894110_20820 [Spirochaetia bacterium]
MGANAPGVMTINQEDALKDFLENVTEPFTLEDITAFVRMVEPKQSGRLSMEIASLIDSRNIAFRLDSRHWVSRRGCFESVPFVINPTKLELLNGILIPGHRCIPFANPDLLPQEYVFYWRGSPVPATTTEGPPDDFYPYYCLFGEEYAPQYVARDNPENEEAFNCDPYEDPPEVSITTLDMRNIYRESAFVPGDRFVVKTRDWRAGIFDLERVGKDEWPQTELYAWLEAAEGGFEDAFSLLGPGSCTEEQIAYAYWYGGKRMREIPAYSLEDFLFEKTDRIETVAYGIESRFWFAGKEIPDSRVIESYLLPPDRTLVEDILFRRQVPISEYVIQSYVRDALFHGEEDVPLILERIVPPSIHLEEREWKILAGYILDTLDEFKPTYTPFADQAMGPIRQRVGELHTAVIDLLARLNKGGVDPSWLPKHTYIVLSQIQGHAVGVLEDLDSDEGPPEGDLEAMDNSLDSMIETYEDIKELIEEALDTFRRSNLSVVKPRPKDGKSNPWRMVQISIGGTGVWRRAAVPESYRLQELHRVIQGALNWQGASVYRFSVEKKTNGLSSRAGVLDSKLKIEDLCGEGISELIYEYGTKWTVKVIILPRYDGEDAEAVRCVAGEGASPPEFIDGPLRFRKSISALERGNELERQTALHELGQNFKAEYFDLEGCNRNLNSGILKTGFYAHE